MLGFTQVGNGFTALAIALILFLTSERFLAYELILGTLTLWLVVELVKALVAPLAAFYPFDPGAHRRQPGARAIFPERAYQPGFFRRQR